MTWYGFDIFKFERDFVPENIDSDGFSLHDYTEAKFGKDAANLIRAILEYQADPTILNVDLKEFMDGEKKEFSIISGTFLKPVEKRVVGNVYYPFAMHKEGTSYTITHLPAGYFIVMNLTKSAALDIMSMLSEEFSDSMYTVEYSQETYNKLLEKVGHLR